MRGGSVTVVYIDLLFLLNFVANYLLLLAAGRMSGNPLHRGRIAAGAALGAFYSAAVFLPGLNWLSAWPCRMGCGVLMVLSAYGTGRLLRVCVFFFCASAALAGGVLAVELLGGSSLTVANGVLYSHADLRLLLLLFVLCYFLLSLFFRRLGEPRGRQMARLLLEFPDRQITLTALVDTGHSLTDPVTNQPVIVAEWGCLAACLPPGLRADNPVDGLKLCRELGWRGTRLIPYRAVGVEGGLLLAVRARRAVAEGQVWTQPLIALSPTPLDDGGGYQALIGVSN